MSLFSVGGDVVGGGPFTAAPAVEQPGNEDRDGDRRLFRYWPRDLPQSRRRGLQNRRGRQEDRPPGVALR